MGILKITVDNKRFVRLFVAMNGVLGAKKTTTLTMRRNTKVAL